MIFFFFLVWSFDWENIFCLQSIRQISTKCWETILAFVDYVGIHVDLRLCCSPYSVYCFNVSSVMQNFNRTVFKEEFQN